MHVGLFRGLATHAEKPDVHMHIPSLKDAELDLLHSKT